MFNTRVEIRLLELMCVVLYSRCVQSSALAYMMFVLSEHAAVRACDGISVDPPPSSASNFSDRSILSPGFLCEADVS